MCDIRALVMLATSIRYFRLPLLRRTKVASPVAGDALDGTSPAPLRSALKVVPPTVTFIIRSSVTSGEETRLIAGFHRVCWSPAYGVVDSIVWYCACREIGPIVWSQPRFDPGVMRLISLKLSSPFWASQ